MVNINPEHKKQIEKKLSEVGTVDLNKLSKLQMLQVAKQCTKLYNNICIDCKTKVIQDSASIKELDDLCELCQENYIIINIFIKLQEIYKKTK